MTTAYRPPDVEAPAPTANRVTGARGTTERESRQSSAMLDARTVPCACCRRPISGATSRLLAAHASCWRHAGERIRRVSRAVVERREQAEIAAWRDEFEAEEARLQEIERKLQANGYQTVRIPAASAEGWR
jgi:hypothetical protein